MVAATLQEKKVPEDVPILMVLTHQIREIMNVFYRNGVPVPSERLIAWEEDMITYGQGFVRIFEGEGKMQETLLERVRCSGHMGRLFQSHVL
jgi:hypothetical protein